MEIGSTDRHLRESSESHYKLREQKELKMTYIKVLVCVEQESKIGKIRRETGGGEMSNSMLTVRSLRNISRVSTVYAVSK